MAFLEWSEQLAVGYRLIDTDHKRLIDLINKLHDLGDSHENRDVVNEALASLVAGTKAHFVHEETLMRKAAYPQFIPHKIEHDRLMSQIEDFRKRYAAGQIGLSQDTLVFLRTWFTDHVTKVDRFLGEFLNKYMPQPAA